MQNVKKIAYYTLQLIAIVVLGLLLSIDDFVWPQDQNGVVYVVLSPAMTTGTDGACLAAAMKVKAVLEQHPPGTLAKTKIDLRRQHDQNWWPFKDRIINLDYVNWAIQSAY